MNISKWRIAFYECATFFTKIAFLMKNITHLSIKFEQTSCINEVLFYGADDEEQRRQVGLNNLFCIYYTMIHASESIEICVPKLTSETICKCLSHVRQNNVIIRLIIYHDNKKHIDFLKKNGAEVKVVYSKTQLEHEFILIDAESGQDAVAIIGSIDYDVNHVNTNRHSTLLISDAKVITPLKREFERIWDNTV